MLLTLITIWGWILAQVQEIPLSTDGGLIIKILIPTASVSGTLYLVWYYTFKQNKKDYSNALKQNQEQFQFALNQNQKQFDKALEQIEKQHKENLEESRRINDRLFEVIRKDSEYKEILTGVLTEMKNELVNHTKEHERE
jgi:mevalonate kinase